MGAALICGTVAFVVYFAGAVFMTGKSLRDAFLAAWIPFLVGYIGYAVLFD